MPTQFNKMVKSLGLLTAIKLYVQIKLKPHGKVSITGFAAPIYLRARTTDYVSFKQVFLNQQYHVSFPFEVENIIDAGSNIGLAAIFFSHKYPNSKVVAIEPNKENFAILSQHISSYPNITGLCKGLWHKDAYLSIINTEADKNAFMVSETFENNPSALPAVCINTILKEQKWTHIDLLKIDIEGAEKEVFEANYDYWLPKTRAVIIELHDRMKPGSSRSVFKAISQYNFSFDMQEENLIFINLDWQQKTYF